MHGPLEIILISDLLSMLETVVLLYVLLFILIVLIYFGTCDTFWGFIDKLKVKKKHLFEIEMFSNNINLYYHCFYQFNKSLLNKS